MSDLAADLTHLATAARTFPRGFYGHTYHITPTGPEHAAGLGELTLSVQAAGGFHYQDYFTPDQADLLAGALRAAARTARQRASEARAATPEAA